MIHVTHFFRLFCRADNNKLKSDLRKRDEEVASLQAALERFTVAVSNITFLRKS